SGVGSESGAVTLTSGGLTKSGSGTWTVTGLNPYQGATNLNGGVLSANSASAIGDAGAFNVINFDGGTLRATDNIDLSVNRSVTLKPGGGTFDVLTNFTVNAMGTVSGIGNLTKLGGGFLALSNVNTNSGSVNINGGGLSVNASNNLGDASVTNVLTFDGGALITPIAFDLTPNRTVLLNAGGGTFEVGANTLTVPAVISGPGSLTKRGSGILAPTAANTFSGAVNINAGVLTIATSG